MVIIPAIEYQLMGVVLNEKECKSLMAPFNKLVKHTLKLPSTTANHIIYDKHQIIRGFTKRKFNQNDDVGKQRRKTSKDDNANQSK
ncbi:hypothetical protein RclHR1_04710002 [Rhizophagus clarus]|uniref:Uncharacterized protein n=1 Tax=Rhizophagus clarus TaxID=94130 RepID=A0A2Z6RK28_9GLOM|nr:hypothetical protein RclHR1_04710002 [Rhizophagus clarus]GES82221.1 hypothetical protein GLOIN_2v1471201 [Rhizophagus clarus]